MKRRIANELSLGVLVISVTATSLGVGCSATDADTGEGEGDGSGTASLEEGMATDPTTEAEATARPDYVRTPAGLYHRDCTPEIDDGASIDDGDGIVTRPDGTRY